MCQACASNLLLTPTRNQKFHPENRNHEISWGTGNSNNCSIRDLFCISFTDVSTTRHSISYTRHDDDRETRRLTIDLLRYRVEREFPSLDPRNSQCGSWRHLSHLYNANFYKVRGYSEPLLFLTSDHAESATNLEFTGYYSEIREAV